MSGHTLLCSSADETMCSSFSSDVIGLATAVPLWLFLLLWFVCVKHFMYFRLDHHACGTIWQQFIPIQVCMTQNDFAIIAEKWMKKKTRELSTHAHSMPCFLLSPLWSACTFSGMLFFCSIVLLCLYTVDSSIILNHVCVFC